MKKVIIGSVLMLSGLLGTAVLLAGTMANSYTLNGALSSFGNLSKYGLMPAFYSFVAISIFGITVASWGTFGIKKQEADV